MKQITFLRHAKSDWAIATLKDIDRALNERGYKEAYAQSEWFLELKQMPDFIYSSSATRALSTALIFVRTMDYPMSKFLISEKLYETNVNYLLDFIKQQNNTLKHIMIAGHNPATTDICNNLLKEGSIDEVPTCGLMSIQFNCSSWKEIKLNTGTLKFYQFPNIKKN